MGDKSAFGFQSAFFGFL